MKYTNEELDKLAQNPFAQYLASLMGFDLNELIKQEKSRDTEYADLKDVFATDIENTLNKMVKDGILTCEETVDNGVTRRFYNKTDKEKSVETTEPVKEGKKYVQPVAKGQAFLMNAEQLEKFINDYSSIIEAEKKIAYLFGIEFKDGDAGFGFPSKLNEIIWNFVRIIFGDENAEDIADYIFGNSNFDNVKSLYDELT